MLAGACKVTAGISFFLILCSVGGLERDTISIHNFLLVVIVLFTIFGFSMYLGNKKGW